MGKRDKIIEHMIDCINTANGLANIQWVFIRLDVLKDALTLLKEQKPRLITQKDFIDNQIKDAIGRIPVWVEYRRDGGWKYVFDDDDDGWSTIWEYDLSDERCRYWTAQPSKKQMEETPWS